jgi:DNA-binding NtrC family response regulator
MNIKNQIRQTSTRPSFLPQSSATHSRARPSVLIIDDDPDITAALTLNLELHGFFVKVSNRAAEALRTVMAQDFDAIICDMVMPTMRGDMFYLAVSKVKPHLCKRFVFITGCGSEPSIAAFLAAAQRPVLHKPLAISDLLEVLPGGIETGNPHFDLDDLDASTKGILAMHAA